MGFINFIIYWLARAFRKPLFWFIRTAYAPADLPADLNLDPNKPVVYLLPTGSITNRMVLEQLCRTKQLPRPKRKLVGLPDTEHPACLYLPALAGVQTHSTTKRAIPIQFESLIKEALEIEDYDLQVVPVSVFWGRNPGKENSLFKLMFSDSRERGNRFRKLFIILVQGRNCLVNFGQPLNMREFVATETDPGQIRRKLSRVLRVHFRRQRVAVLGPTLADRHELVNSLLNKPAIQTEIEQLMSKEDLTREAATKKARKYGLEIAADYSSATIRFLYHVLTWIWSKIFDGVEIAHAERLRAIAQNHEIIYLPSHRSHFDYLLLSYILYSKGLVPPHIAAGINLNFWPVGNMLRRGGAFYLRRSFSGNKLYSAVFRGYVEILLQRGYSINFFPEGGRSRTGRLLNPKTGMMAMVLEGYLRNPSKPIVFVPVYIGYDKVAEGGSYVKELRGGRKKKESAGQLVAARKVLKSSYGKTWVSFGNPIPLDDFLTDFQPDWRASTGQQEPPEWIGACVNELANKAMTRINSTACVSPVALVGNALLASPQKAIAEDELIQQLDAWLALLRACPYSLDITIPDMDGKALLAYAEPICGLGRVPHPWGDVIVAEGRAGTLLTYYRNNIQHLLAIPSLIANSFNSNEELEVDQILQNIERFYPLLHSEFFLRWRPEDVEPVVRDYIEALVGLDLLLLDPITNKLRRPPVSSTQFALWSGLARILRETIERYCLTTLLLVKQLDTGSIDRKEFETQCQVMAERLAIISGRNAPEFFDASLFRNYLNTLVRQELLTPDSADKNRLQLDPKLKTIANRSMRLLGQDVQQSLLQLANRPEPKAEPIQAEKTKGKE